MTEEIFDDESLRRLREFLRQLEKLLADLSEYPRPAIPGRHHESMTAAWSIVQPKFTEAIQGLKMDEASNIIPKLHDVGLMSYELVFKLSIFHHAHDELLDHGTPKDGEPNNRPWWKRCLNLLKPTLKAADVILGSLATVLPIVEAIKEYKDSVESGVELGQAAAEIDQP